MEKDMIKAAKNGDMAKIKELLAAQSDLLQAVDTDGSTPLHFAAWKGHKELAQFLLETGADVHAVNTNTHWGTTPLHAAAHANQAAIVQMLLDAGADINAVDASGNTPLVHTTFHKANAAAKVLGKHSSK